MKVSEFSGYKTLNGTFDTVIVREAGRMEQLKDLTEWAESSQAQNLMRQERRRSGIGGISMKNDDGIFTIEQISETAKQMIIPKEKRTFVGWFYILRFLSENSTFYYPACVNEKCNRKVVESEFGFRCENCNKDFPEPRYRYRLQAYLADHTESLKITIFDEVATEILG